MNFWNVINIEITFLYDCINKLIQQNILPLCLHMGWAADLNVKSTDDEEYMQMTKPSWANVVILVVMMIIWKQSLFILFSREVNIITCKLTWYCFAEATFDTSVC